MPSKLVSRVLNRRAYPSRLGGWIRPLILLTGLGALVPLALYELYPVNREWISDGPVQPPVEIRRTSLMRQGWEIILDPGKAGIYRALVRARSRGGRMQDIREAERRLVSRPRSVERLMGTSAQDNLVNAPRLTQVEREYRMLATAYDAGPVDNTWEYAGITTLGWRTRRGIAAVDPAVIPLRTLLYVEGYGFAWAGDVGGAIKGKRIDLCFNKTEDVHKWGKKYVRVYVLRGVRKRK